MHILYIIYLRDYIYMYSILFTCEIIYTYTLYYLPARLYIYTYTLYYLPARLYMHILYIIQLRDTNMAASLMQLQMTTKMARQRLHLAE